MSFLDMAKRVAPVARAEERIPVDSYMQSDARDPGHSPHLTTYLLQLHQWRESGSKERPPSPGSQFPDRPERPLAWAAHWDEVSVWRRRIGVDP
jgi:hypothetical protein